jgi:hypothetical protein
MQHLLTWLGFPEGSSSSSVVLFMWRCVLNKFMVQLLGVV